MFNSLSTILATISLSIMYNSATYLEERQSILNLEKQQFIGGDLKLSNKEKQVNDIVLAAKHAELQIGYENSAAFLPSQHFGNQSTKEAIEKSKVYAVIKSIPKGASLHTHMLAGVSADFLIKNITYRTEPIYYCFLNQNFKLTFMKDNRCNWKNLKDLRNSTANFDDWLKQQLTLTDQIYPAPELAWKKFKQIFTTLYDLLCFRPVFELYIYELLNELYNDNVMYTELKGTFMPLYELDGQIHNTSKYFEIFAKTVAKFKQDHPKFIGAKYIHSVYKGVTNDTLRASLAELLIMKNHYPNLIAGFDFVGYEEEGNNLLDFHEILLEYKQHFKYFFHAGETNWFGHTDLNLLDALLLNSTRIGHGFALVKHPALMEKVKSQKIAIEVCPISNQMLLLNQDARNHPGAVLLAHNLPVVICNDDPAIWGASGLSYDWYIAFMAMTPSDGGLEILKQLALNSIEHSELEGEEKLRALQQWNDQWVLFLNGFDVEKCS